MVHLDLQYEKKKNKDTSISCFLFFFIVSCFYTSGLSNGKLICFLMALFDFSPRHTKPLHWGSGVKKFLFCINLKCQPELRQLQKFVDFVILNTVLSAKYDQSNHAPVEKGKKELSHCVFLQVLPVYFLKRTPTERALPRNSGATRETSSLFDVCNVFRGVAKFVCSVFHSYISVFLTTLASGHLCLFVYIFYLIMYISHHFESYIICFV